MVEHEARRWRVVSQAVVRTSIAATSSWKGRLAIGALVEELQCDGERLHFRLLDGKGPSEGWVNVTMGSNDLLVRSVEEVAQGTHSGTLPPPSLATGSSCASKPAVAFKPPSRVDDGGEQKPERRPATMAAPSSRPGPAGGSDTSEAVSQAMKRPNDTEKDKTDEDAYETESEDGSETQTNTEDDEKSGEDEGSSEEAEDDYDEEEEEEDNDKEEEADSEQNSDEEESVADQVEEPWCEAVGPKWLANDFGEVFRADKEAPLHRSRLVVKSSNTNLRGVYTLVAGGGLEDSAGDNAADLVYQRERGGTPFIYTLDGSWLIGEQPGEAKAFFKAYREGAPYPWDIHHWINVSENNGPQIERLGAMNTRAAPSALRIRSKCRNLRGCYKRLDINFEHYPAYEKVAMESGANEAIASNNGSNCKDRAFLFHDLGLGSWFVSPELGDTNAFCKSESDELDVTRLPTGTWKPLDSIARIDPLRLDVDTRKVPAIVRLHSRFRNLRGCYFRVERDFQRYPAYATRSERQGTLMYLYHDLLMGAWHVGTELGGGTSLNECDSDEVDVTTLLSHFWQKPEGIEKVVTAKLELDWRAVPSMIRIHSKYVNIRGCYSRAPENYQQYPVYRSISKEKRAVYLFHSISTGAWALSAELGSSDTFNECDCDRADVTKLKPSIWRKQKGLRKITSLPSQVDGSSAPSVVRIQSSYTNIRGCYFRLEDDFQGYPAYRSAEYREDQLHLFHDFELGVWFLSAELGGTTSFEEIESDQVNVSELDIGRSGRRKKTFCIEQIQSVRLPLKTGAIPTTVRVYSKYGNLRGLYSRVEDYQEFPAYKCNAGEQKALFHDLDLGLWLFAKDVGDTCSLNECKADVNDVTTLVSEGWSKPDCIDKIEEVPERTGCEKLYDAKLVVKSTYANVRGAYSLTGFDDFDYPVYQRERGKAPFIYLFDDRFWMIGDEVGKGRSYFKVAKGDSRSPLDVPAWGDPGKATAIRVTKLKVDTREAPVAVRVHSKFRNIGGCYVRLEDDFDHYPAYESLDDGDDRMYMYLFHDIGLGRWFFSTSLGDSASFNECTSEEIDVTGLCSEMWRKPDGIAKITKQDSEALELRNQKLRPGQIIEVIDTLWIGDVTIEAGAGAKILRLDGKGHINAVLQGGTNRVWIQRVDRDKLRVLRDLQEPLQDLSQYRWASTAGGEPELSDAQLVHEYALEQGIDSRRETDLLTRLRWIRVQMRKHLQEDRHDFKAWVADILSHELREVPGMGRTLDELIAGVAAAVIFTSGYRPRHTQILTLMVMLEKAGEGCLLEVKTGEGKSEIVKMFAAVQFLCHTFCDVVTSSQVLARRDAEDSEPFFSLLGITVGHNCQEGCHMEPKKCYERDVVYGTVHHYCWDFLADEYQGCGTRCGRSLGVVIADESDSMLIDQVGDAARFSYPLPGFNNMSGVLAFIWAHLTHMCSWKEQLDSPPDEVIQEMVVKRTQEALDAGLAIKSTVTDILGSQGGKAAEGAGRPGSSRGRAQPSQAECAVPAGTSVPAHLVEYVRQKIPTWVKNAVHVHSKMQENVNYLLTRTEEGLYKISPIAHTSTGVVQLNTVLSDGVHQFLQLKHGLTVTPEGLTTIHMCNITFFKRFGRRVYGLTGTLGSQPEENMLRATYDIGTKRMPTFRKSQLREVGGTMISRFSESESLQAWTDAVVQVTREVTHAGRCELVVCNSISDGEHLARELREKGHDVATYFRADDPVLAAAGEKVIKEGMCPGKVLVATNLAGRGTDIWLPRNVVENGGMHVVVTFFPKNQRVERQAFGRAGRKGDPGTCQLVINLGGVKPWRFEDGYVPTVEELKYLRQKLEVDVLADAEVRARQLVTQDEVFLRMESLMHRISADAMAAHGKAFKELQVNGLEERWGFWLRDRKPENSNEEWHSAFEDFERCILNDVKAGRVSHNPFYYAVYAAHLNSEEKFGQALEVLDHAISIDGAFCETAYYHRAYAKLAAGWVQGARDDLETCKEVVRKIILCQLNSLSDMQGAYDHLCESPEWCAKQRGLRRRSSSSSFTVNRTGPPPLRAPLRYIRGREPLQLAAQRLSSIAKAQAENKGRPAVPGVTAKAAAHPGRRGRSLEDMGGRDARCAARAVKSKRGQQFDEQLALHALSYELLLANIDRALQGISKYKAKARPFYTFHLGERLQCASGLDSEELPMCDLQEFASRGFKLLFEVIDEDTLNLGKCKRVANGKGLYSGNTKLEVLGGS